MGSESKKVKTKAKINWGWNAPEERKGKASRSTNKQTKRKLKKLGFRAILIILLVTLIGACIGAGACWFVCRNDCFDIIGKDEITLEITINQKQGNEMITVPNKYVDDGVRVVSFGRDVSDKVQVETNLKQNTDGSYYADEVGTYHIIYKVDDIKYGKIFTIQRIRLITFVEGMPENKL